MSINILFKSRKDRAKIYNDPDYEKPHPNWKNEPNKKTNGWLYEEDIDNVLRQCEEKYPEFIYFGTETVDFWYERPDKYYCGKTFEDYKRDGKTKFAIVLNLFGNYKVNQYKKHWVTIFIDAEKGLIEYFDSSLFDILDAVKHTLYKIGLGINYIYHDGNENAINIKWNKKKVQKNPGECGIYAIDYVASRLAGITMEDYIHNDHDIVELRKKYFNEPKK